MIWFEFDEVKSHPNFTKHGIDFVEAQHLWDDPKSVVIPAETRDEPRFLLIGKIGRKHWSAVFTVRMRKVRIISARRARKEEVALYESEEF